MSDFISRQDTIEELEHIMCDHPLRGYEDEQLLINAVKSLPSAEPKTGKWIDETFKPWGLVYHPYKCDQCGEHSEATSNFCPWCGARMYE